MPTQQIFTQTSSHPGTRPSSPNAPSFSQAPPDERETSFTQAPPEDDEEEESPSPSPAREPATQQAPAGTSTFAAITTEAADNWFTTLQKEVL
ncbi:hypothetical protein EC991_002506, partial [Linnemannia zychae]